ncbi:DMT family transporter [Paenibacillus thermotolerans]|uniref:DMT family transporter n=1 Tax=Paenibacillus thermotolerans TaxID=3027807 RepID=UPI002367850D|nr:MULTISPECIES: DMT family transporter [unclassified Paenibacillus]
MIVIPLILVLCSGLAHAVWNMLAKKSTDKPVFLWAMYLPTTLALIPALVNELSRIQLTAQGWLTIGLSLAMQAVYSALLAYTYKAGDLSQVYPIMRGLPTLLIPVFGVVLLGEKLPLWGWLGIGCMLIGFLVMIGRVPGREHRKGDLKPVLLALGVGLCITTYTLIDKVNLQHLSPLALLEVTNIGFMLGLTPSALHVDRLKRVVRTHLNILWIGSILSPGSYLLFLFAARNTDVSMVAPMREVGIVFGTLLGFFVLKESQGYRRIAASVAVVLGIMMIATSGH